MSAADDALAVARECWPLTDSFWWDSKFGRVHGAGGLGPRVWDYREHSDIAAAERVLVERGLGEKYAVAVALILRREDTERPRQERNDYSDVLLGLTAPLDVRLRAMARVVREQQPKETK